MRGKGGSGGLGGANSASDRYGYGHKILECNNSERGRRTRAYTQSPDGRINWSVLESMGR